MKKFLITYDLKTLDRTYYNGLYEAIKALGTGTWWHYLDSTWIIKSSNLTANEIYEKLKQYVNESGGDHIFITDLGTDMQGWLPTDAWNWLNS